MEAATCPPPSITHLSRLRRVCFLPHTGDADTPEPPAAALPVGPWAGSLQQLAAPFEVLLLSGQLLAAAGRLEQVSALAGVYAADGQTFWHWAATHRPLRQLRYERFRTLLLPRAFKAALRALRSARPELQVRSYRAGRLPALDACGWPASDTALH